MEQLLKIKIRTFAVLYVLIDLICIGGGMGVPIFCILLGFPLGWYIAKRISLSEERSQSLYAGILKLSVLSATFTFLSMAIIWGVGVLLFLESSADVNNFGHPFILYDPKASFIGWLILMIFISPFLQLLTTVFASFVTLMINKSENHNNVRHAKQ